MERKKNGFVELKRAKKKINKEAALTVTRQMPRPF